MSLSIFLVSIALFLAGFIEFSKKLENNKEWKATVTPLASIMGSGFLISAPLLATVVGTFAIVYMALLLGLAYLVGSSIRFNIKHFEPVEHKSGHAQEIAFVSRIVLCGAYLISVSYYLQLLSAFVLRALGSENEIVGKFIATSILLLIGGAGIKGGLKGLERFTRFAVSLNLGVIGALLVGLLLYNFKLLIGGSWALPNLDTVIDLHDLRVVLGLLIVVQGFETSRYLGDEHSPEQRIKTMRLAQMISACIYLMFIGLSTVLFANNLNADVTSIIDMTRPVAFLLPIMLGVAAIGSQFGASVADNSGAGGLIEDISNRKVSINKAYLLILILTITITWQTNVNEIIAYASRAFALYYTFQGAVAFLTAQQKKQLPNRIPLLILFAFVSLAAGMVFAFGVPSG